MTDVATETVEQVKEGPKIHDPQAKVRQWEEERAALRKEETQIMSLRHVKELDERVKSLEFHVSELERGQATILAILEKASTPDKKQKSA